MQNFQLSLLINIMAVNLSSTVKQLAPGVPRNILLPFFISFRDITSGNVSVSSLRSGIEVCLASYYESFNKTLHDSGYYSYKFYLKFQLATKILRHISFSSRRFDENNVFHLSIFFLQSSKSTINFNLYDKFILTVNMQFLLLPPLSLSLPVCY